MPNEYIKEYIEYSKKADEEVLAYILAAFLELGFKPREPLEKFVSWFEKRIQKYKISGAQLEHCVDSYYDYWSEQPKGIKNFKTSFFNNYKLRGYLLEEYKDDKDKQYYNI